MLDAGCVMRTFPENVGLFLKCKFSYYNYENNFDVLLTKLSFLISFFNINGKISIVFLVQVLEQRFKKCLNSKDFMVIKVRRKFLYFQVCKSNPLTFSICGLGFALNIYTLSFTLLKFALENIIYMILFSNTKLQTRPLKMKKGMVQLLPDQNIFGNIL